MPFPLAVFWAISLILLWPFAGGLLLLALLLGGMIYYACRHIIKECNHTGIWNLASQRLLGNMLGGNLLLLIIYMFYGVNWRDPLLMTGFLITAVFIEAYALIMAMQKTELK